VGAASFPLCHLAEVFGGKLNASPPIFIDSFCAGAIFSSLSLSLSLSTFRDRFSCFCYCFPPLEFELQKSILGSRVWVFPLVCGLGQVCLLFTVQVTQSRIGALISMGFRFKLALWKEFFIFYFLVLRPRAVCLTKKLMSPSSPGHVDISPLSAAGHAGPFFHPDGLISLKFGVLLW
jgi:hypothetical protein